MFGLPRREEGAMARTIVVMATGGTIAMASKGDGGVGVVPRLDSQSLLHAVGQWLPKDVAVRGETVANLPSANLTVADAARLALRIRRAAAEGVAGVVVSQGTDTLEEMAFLLSLFLGTPPVPVVVTGAMRPASAAGADGPANLLGAVHLAADETARGFGVLVAMADRVFAAADVTKAHTHFVDAFAAHQGAPIGTLREGRVVWHAPFSSERRPAPCDPERFIATRSPAHVPIIEALFDADPARALAALEGADAAVLRAFGGGHVPADWVDPLAAYATRRPLVLASRVPFGGVCEATYGYPGSERHLIARGLIPAGRLNAQKARLALMLLAADGAGRDDVAGRYAALAGA